jgi:hypothetical protein
MLCDEVGPSLAGIAENSTCFGVLRVIVVRTKLCAWRGSKGLVDHQSAQLLLDLHGMGVWLYCTHRPGCCMRQRWSCLLTALALFAACVWSAAAAITSHALLRGWFISCWLCGWLAVRRTQPALLCSLCLIRGQTFVLAWAGPG